VSQTVRYQRNLLAFTFRRRTLSQGQSQGHCSLSSRPKPNPRGHITSQHRPKASLRMPRDTRPVGSGLK